MLRFESKLLSTVIMKSTKVHNPQCNMDTCASLLNVCPCEALSTYVHGINACTNYIAPSYREVYKKMLSVRKCDK